MVACVHVAKILPGKREEYMRQLQEAFETGRDGLRAFGFTRIISFTTPEVAEDGDGLLVTVYEAEDPSVVERFYKLEPVLQQEAQAPGRPGRAARPRSGAEERGVCRYGSAVIEGA